MFEGIQSYIVDYKIRNARRYIQNIVRYNIDKKIQKKNIPNDNFESTLHSILPDPTKSEDIHLIL